MSAEDVRDCLTHVCVLDLATVNSGSRPFVAPVDGLFLRGKFWFGSSQSSLRFRHLRRNCWVSAAHTRGEEISILVHGKAVEVDIASGEFEGLHDYCREVYDGFDSWGTWGEQPYAYVEAEKMFAIRIVHN